MLQVYRPSDNAMRFNLPNEFYQLTMDDIKKEQKLRWAMMIILFLLMKTYSTI